MRQLLVTACGALLLATAPLAAQDKTKRYVAPTDATVFAEVEEGYGDTPVRIVYVYNHSSVPVTVYSVALRDCENIKQSCSPRKLNMKLQPGSRAQVARVEPKNPFMSNRFAYSFGWRADSAAIAALQLLASAGSAQAKEQLDARAEAQSERRAIVGSGDVFLDQAAIDQLGLAIVGLRVEPDSVVLPVGGQFLVRRVRVMAVDSTGASLGRIGAVRWRFPAGVLRNAGDTLTAVTPGNSSVEFSSTTTATPYTAVMRVIVSADTSRKQ